MRNELQHELNIKFENNTTKLYYDQNDLKKILTSNETFCQTLSLRGVKVLKHKKFQNQEYVLVAISKEMLFKKIDFKAKQLLEDIKDRYKKSSHKIPLERYHSFQNIRELLFPYITMNEFQKIILRDYNTLDSDILLNKIQKEYFTFKNNITIHVLGDLASKDFTPHVKNAFLHNALSCDLMQKTKHTYRVILKTQTQDYDEYGFHMSKSVVVFQLYNSKQQLVSSKRHTFIGKSRKSYGDAHLQTALNVRARIAKLGIYEIVGIN